MKKLSTIAKLVAGRYHTANPFTIAEKLNIQVEWCPLADLPLGKIIYDGKQPVIMLNDNIKHRPAQYFVLGHELGHAIMQEGLVGYYTSSVRNKSQLETDADQFSVALMALLFVEDNDRLPDSYDDLATQYGLPHNKIPN